jgi:tetracycline 7-halogenase / FADH2 O2-dependent halogenase
VRPWVSTDRLQYTSTRTVGARWCLLSHAAGFIDPLYSRGLTNTGEVVNALAYRLLRALAEDRFDAADSAYVERLQQGLIRYNDELVNCSFIAWSDFDLWNAVYRVWAAAQVPMGMHLGRALERFARSGDDSAFTELETYDHPGLPFPGNAAYKQLFDDMVRVCEEVDRGERPAADAGRELMKCVISSPAVLPFLGLADPSVRYVNAGPEMFAEVGRWIATEAPAELRYLADVPRLARAAAQGGAR